MSFIREIVKRFTRSKEWPKVRNAYLKKHAECAACGTSKKLEVHHKQPFHLHPELELEEDNLITLCDGASRCHFLIGHLTFWKSYNLGAQQDAEKWALKIKNRPTN